MTLENFQLFDSHVHLWRMKYVHDFVNYMESIGITHILVMANPKLKPKLERENFNMKIEFCRYLSTGAFSKFDTKKLEEQINEAQKFEIKVIKLFFAPRNYSRRKCPFRINDLRLGSVYSLLEDYNMKIIVHLADPDIWYQKNQDKLWKFGTKELRINDFSHVLETYPKLRVISAHFGCLPENLPRLGELFDKFPQLYVDTASTRWVIRELGKNKEEAKSWIDNYHDRILFGSDMANLWIDPRFFFSLKRRKAHWNSRYMSQKLFWETSEIRSLLFKDYDNPNGTIIYGLNLPKKYLENIYFKNALKFFEIKN